MTTRETPWPAGTPCWVDLAVDDFAKAQAFYSGLFGWEVPVGPADFGGYSTCTKDGLNVAGIMPKMQPEQPSVWVTYLATDDAEATMAKVAANGGQQMVSVMPVGSMGSMAVAVDAGGAVFGLWESGDHTGFQLANEPGSVTWNEQFSRTWEDSKRFYTSLFGWTYDDLSSDGFEYATFAVDGQVAGGIGVLGAGMESLPPYWNVYFKVADADLATGEVRRLGGTVQREAWDTPFGRMALVADDQGTPFMVMADAR